MRVLAVIFAVMCLAWIVTHLDELVSLGTLIFAGFFIWLCTDGWRRAPEYDAKGRP